MQSKDCAFSILDANDPAEAAQWSALWESWPAREVFAHPNYARLFCDENSRALCAVWDTDEGRAMYPFLFRDVKKEPFCLPGIEAAADLVTPYGYGGPVFWGGDANTIAEGFWNYFSDWCGRRGVVSEFVRFSLFRDAALAYPGEQEESRLNVVRDLCADEDTIWMSYDHDVRTNVRKAQSYNVQVEVDPTGERVEDFLRVYYSTMNRRDADDTYYFPRSFFEQLRDGLAGQFCFFHAVWGGNVVSTELVLLSAENAYAFLGGTDREAFHVRPNDMLRHHIILWTRQAVKKRYVLGGGYQPDDGIFRQKKRFAPGSYAPFMVGRRVINTDLYDRLIERRRAFEAANGVEWSPKPGYFPAYRG